MPVAGGGFEQAYNAQALVAADSLLVVTNDVVQAPNDKRQIEPALEALARLPEALGAPETLLAPARRRRPDHRLQGETGDAVERRRARHRHIRAVVDRLRTALVVAIDRRLDGRLLEAGSRRAVVTADQLDDVGPVGRATEAADHEADRIARPGADAIAVAEE